MTILEQLIRQIPDDTIDEVIVGVHSVLVKAGTHAGIASTIKYCSPADGVRDAGSLESRGLKNLAELALSDNLIEASIGMAAINCGINRHEDIGKELNAKEIILEKGRNKKVGIIGHFPFLEEQRDHYKTCYVFEKFPQKGDLTEKDIPTYLPTVDVVALTGTTLTNHSFEGIAAYLPPSSFKIMLGPSTPLSPLLFDRGMNCLSGSVVSDYKQLKKHVLQATPTRHLPGLKMISIMKEDKK